MIRNIKKNYDNVTVKLDNGKFVRCKFKNCRLRFGGTGPVSLIECEFSGVSWEFTGPAQNTMTFLRGVYHGIGEGGKKLVEATFDEIRKPDGGGDA